MLKKKGNEEKKTKKISPISKSQVYCKAFPEAKAYYSEQENYKKTKKQFDVFQNATKFCPVKFNQRFYIIGDTSAFDSLMEILYFTYRSYKNFKMLCDNVYLPKDSENNVLKLLKDFYSKGNYANFYTKRFHILLEKGFIRELILSKIDFNIGNFVNELLENFCYLVEYFTCDSCLISFSNQEVVLSIFEYNTHENFELNNLQKYLILYLEKRKSSATCHKCLHQNLNGRQHFVGPFLIIDICKNNIQDFLTEVPTDLIIFNNTYDLTGIIVSKFLNNVFSKYVAYCRNLINAWYEHDDTQDHVSRVKENNKKKISILFYALRGS